MNGDTYLKAYEDGKHRRYALLFAVNGGAFTVAKLFSESTSTQRCVLGNLTLSEVAWGLIFFTIVMGVDIFAFGYAMRKRAGGPNFLIGVWSKDNWEGIFHWIGRIVLVLICLLVVVGWLKVAGGTLPPPPDCS